MPNNRTIIICITLGVIFFQLMTTTTYAQTCSCGGPPLLGSLESLPGTAGNFQIAITHDYRSISDLVSTTTELDDDTRERYSQSTLLQADYSLTSRMTLSFSFPFVRQSRTIQSLIGNGENIKTQGFGDLMALAKYSLIQSSIFSAQSLAVGFGIKAPTGEPELRDNGLLLSADMQTGTGSYDFILWGATSRVISRSKSINIFASTLYRINGTNDRFGASNDSYRFGNEFWIIAGGSIQVFSKLSQSFSLKYRKSQADKFANQSLASSGGQWYDIAIALNKIIIENIGINISTELPIYRKVEGTQFSTSYTLSFSLFYNLNLKGLKNG